MGEIGGLIEALLAELGLDPERVIELQVQPRSGLIDVTVYDTDRNVRCLKFTC